MTRFKDSSRSAEQSLTRRNKAGDTPRDTYSSIERRRSDIKCTSWVACFYRVWGEGGGEGRGGEGRGGEGRGGEGRGGEGRGGEGRGEMRYSVSSGVTG